jgi:hypothetical protein
MDRCEAVQMATCRACSSSNLTGLLYPSAEWRRLVAPRLILQFSALIEIVDLLPLGGNQLKFDLIVKLGELPVAVITIVSVRGSSFSILDHASG